MDREKKLVKNTIIISVGRICTQLITFLLLPLYTGILTTKEYGSVDLVNTLVSLLLPIVTLQLEQAIYRELIENRENELQRKKIISTGFINIIFQSVIYILFFCSISIFIKNEYKVFLIFNVVTHIIISLFQQIARGLGENTKYAIGSFISAISTIVFNLVFLLLFDFGAKGMLLGILTGYIFGIIYYFIGLKLYKYLKISSYDKKYVKKLLLYSLPLIPNAISWWIFNASDRVIVSSILGIDQNGILAAALKFSTVYITIYNIFNISWTESIAININDDDIEQYFNKTINIILRIFISLAVGIISCMPFVFPIMINENYKIGYGLVPISIIASLFNVIVGLVSVVYVAKKNTKAIANTSIVSSILNIIIHLILIRSLGLYAAVISTFCAYFIMSIYRIIDIRKKYLKIIIEKKLIFQTLVILAIILLTYYINDIYLNITSLVIAIIFTIYINKNSAKFILELVKKKIIHN